MQLKNSVDGGATRVGAKASELSLACTATAGKSIRQQGESHVERKAKKSPASFDSSIAGLGAMSTIARLPPRDRAVSSVHYEGDRGNLPTESLRTENGSQSLPDCRAYEVVTPASKNGAEFGSPIFVSSGLRLAFEGFATFGGAESTKSIGSSYEIVRSPSGWKTNPLAAPSKQFEGTNFVTPLVALSSNGTNLLGLRARGTPSDAESLYIRSGGSITEVGPEAPVGSLRGLANQEFIPVDQNGGYFRFESATPDLSHVLFDLFAPFPGEEHTYLWPFDRTEASESLFFATSLYQYVGTGNSQPSLVGVTGGLGSNDVIGGCGTSLGSQNSSETYNAISADGSKIFFTPWGEDITGPCNSVAGVPGHTELFARIDGDKPSAHTVAISEPSEADCAACQTGVQQEAIFQGASATGSRAFFLTEQELLPGNPGKNLYEYAFDAPAGQKVASVSHRATGEPANVLGVVRVSNDGSRVSLSPPRLSRRNKTRSARRP